MPRSRLRNSKNKTKNKKSPIASTKITNTKNNSIVIKYWKWALYTLTAVLTLWGAFTLPKAIKDYFKSPHDKFLNDEYITGIIAPFSANDVIHISTGSFNYTQMVPLNGYIIDKSIGVGYSNKVNSFDEAFKFNLRAINHRLYLDLIVKDYENDKVIAEINNNKWDFKSHDVKDYDDQNLLEIMDMHNNIAFSLWVDDQRTIQIRGYFTGPSSTVFMNGDSVMQFIDRNDPEYITKCNKLAAKLKPRHLKRAINY